MQAYRPELSFCEGRYYRSIPLKATQEGEDGRDLSAYPGAAMISMPLSCRSETLGERLFGDVSAGMPILHAFYLARGIMAPHVLWQWIVLSFNLKRTVILA